MKRFVLSCLVSLAVGSLLSPAEAAPQKPNVILIFTDDQGYGDVGCYGAKGFKTPNLDRLAADGVRFTDFYVNCPVCSGSRTALLTGCHYQRLSMQPVLFPNSKYGLHPDEVTIAEVLKQQGYATACIGKWHLGHMPPCLPTMQGFDYYFGIPYSNDMTIDPRAPLSKNIVLREGMTVEKIRTGKPIRNKVPLMRGEEVIEYPVDQDTLTRRYTEETIRFIRQHKDEPFFVYLPHTMPHLPLHVSKEFAGRTKTKFGDIMEEIDWSVGEIVKAIADLKLDDKTLIIFTTDNGTRSGSSGPLRGRKASVYEGGIRVPCIMRWKGQIPAGKVCSEVAATIDILPTLAHLTGAELPKRKIDGKNIWPLMKGDPGAKSPHDVYCLAHGRGAVRSGKWKYYPADKQAKAELYDLEKDLSETTNVADQHPEVVKRLQASYEAHVADLRKNRRPAALLKRPELK
ncbi:MAG: arylsulfatase [Gemmatales bacterium]|nr:MAG: arylsulfatase [Gemmatales bacterium]